MVLEEGATIAQDLPGSYNGFIYVLEGSGTFGENKIVAEKGQAMQLDSAVEAEMSSIQVTANEKLRLILFAGEPLKEPVVAYGPFVMNTEEEIHQAYRDYQEGKYLGINSPFVNTCLFFIILNLFFCLSYIMAVFVKFVVKIQKPILT